MILLNFDFFYGSGYGCSTHPLPQLCRLFWSCWFHIILYKSMERLFSYTLCVYLNKVHDKHRRKSSKYLKFFIMMNGSLCVDSTGRTAGWCSTTPTSRSYPWTGSFYPGTKYFLIILWGDAYVTAGMD